MPRRASRLVLNPEFFALVAASLFTRLWRLFTPNAVVFDELHYEHFSGHYLDGTHYFDVHPPLGKLLYAAEARLFGVSAGTLLTGLPAPVLRLLPAVLGALLVPLIYILLRQLGSSRSVAALGGFVVLFDNALLVDSRLILLEPLLISFAVGAVVLYLAARTLGPSARIWTAACAALLAGCALSVKWTGASALAVILVVWMTDGLSANRERRPVLIEGALLVLIPVIVYVSAFAVHFALLPRAGVDDGIMSRSFRATLVGDPMYASGARESLWAKLVDVHRAMGVGNRSLEGVTHPAASPWYTWPIMKHPVALWQDATPRTQSLILVGNPAIWWGAAVGTLIALAIFFRRRGVARRWKFALLFLSGCYLINYLPFIAITRVMYLYHYLFAELCLSVLAAFGVGCVAGWQDSPGDSLWNFPSRKSAALYWGIVVVVVVGFIYFAPLTYGWTLSASQYDARFWVLHPQF